MNAAELIRLGWNRLKKRPPNRPPGHWETVQINREPNGPAGYLVRWSEPDEEGRHLNVGHFYFTPNGHNEEVMRTCQGAAECYRAKLELWGETADDYRGTTDDK